MPTGALTAMGFKIQRATKADFSDAVNVAAVPLGTTSFVDNSIPASGTYYYRMGGGTGADGMAFAMQGVGATALGGGGGSLGYEGIANSLAIKFDAYENATGTRLTEETGLYTGSVNPMSSVWSHPRYSTPCSRLRCLAMCEFFTSEPHSGQRVMSPTIVAAVP